MDMPDGWKPENGCGDCPNYHPSRCNAVFQYCPLRNAKEAIIIENLDEYGHGNGDDIYDVKGHPVQLFTVKKEEGR